MVLFSLCFTWRLRCGSSGVFCSKKGEGASVNYERSATND